MKPTSIQTNPTFKPTPLPSSQPSASPSTQPSGQPFSQPTHVPTFRPSKNVVLRSIKSASAVGLWYQLSNSPEPKASNVLKGANGNLNFGASVNQSYLELTDDIYFLKKAKVLTIEAFVEFDDISRVSDSSSLFSFGTKSSYISFPGAFIDASYQASKTVHIAVVFNFLKGYSKVYRNGKPYFDSKPVVCINGRINDTNYGRDSTVATTFPSPSAVLGSDLRAYIGRNIEGNGGVFYGKLRDFSIWFGELNASTIFSNYFIGSRPDTIYLSPAVTISNLNVKLVSISKQRTIVSFVGGSSTKGKSNYPIFGKETSFRFTSADPMCKYSFVKSLPIDVMVPAMNYKVSLEKCPLPAPIFSSNDSDTCPYSFDEPGECHCAPSLSPEAYLTKSGSNEKLLLAMNITSAPREVIFEYHSGLCIQINGAENFSRQRGKSPTINNDDSSDKISCFAHNTFSMEKAKSKKTVTVLAFERYPAGQWFTSAKLLLQKIAAFNYNVSGVEVRISDAISGVDEAFFKYDPTIVYRSSRDTFGTPRAVTYAINPINLHPIFPFDMKFSVEVSRNTPVGPESVQMTYFIPVVGAIPNEVPNYYPVMSDPNLIFMVLRDPPGGASTASINQGTSATFEISIDGMYTYHKEESLVVETKNGVDYSYLGFKRGENIMNSASHSYEAKRVSNTEYAYTFNFQSTISTSIEPNVAGHASDVIIGGGVNLITNEALSVQRYEYNDTVTNCYVFEKNIQWQAGKISTFIMPIYEIEILVTKLQSILSNRIVTSQFESIKLNQSISDWITVLQTYREHNDEIHPLFTTEAQRYKNLVSVYNEFLRGGLSKDEVLKSMVGIQTLSSNELSAQNGQFEEAFNQYSRACNQFPQTMVSNVYLNTICADFDSQKWQDLYGALTAACYDSSSVSSQNPFFNSTLKPTTCKEFQPDDAKFPGDIENIQQSQSMFSFLQDTSQFVTFSSNSPIEISWTGAVKDTMSFVSTLSYNNPDLFKYSSVYGEIVAGSFKEVGQTSTTLFGALIDIGKSSSQEHSYTRSVTITLSDSNMGDYFVMRITEDPVFGTPVFTTMGGQSKCPAETMTAARESKVTMRIEPRCGPGHNKPCTKQWLGYDSPANFGAIITNASPTGDDVWYSLGLANFFDIFNPVTIQPDEPPAATIYEYDKLEFYGDLILQPDDNVTASSLCSPENLFSMSTLLAEASGLSSLVAIGTCSYGGTRRRMEAVQLDAIVPSTVPTIISLRPSQSPGTMAPSNKPSTRSPATIATFPPVLNTRSSDRPVSEQGSRYIYSSFYLAADPFTSPEPYASVVASTKGNLVAAGAQALSNSPVLSIKNASLSNIVVLNGPTQSPAISVNPTLAPSMVARRALASKVQRTNALSAASPIPKSTNKPTAVPTMEDLYCGSPNQQAGLIVQFSQTDIQEIPYLKEIEVSFSVTRTGLCHKYLNLKVQLTSTCERPSSSSFKYQYGVYIDDDNVQKIDYAKLVIPDAVIGTFSVTWDESPPLPSENARRLSQDRESDIDQVAAKLLEQQSMGESRLASLLLERDIRLKEQLFELISNREMEMKSDFKNILATNRLQDTWHLIGYIFVAVAILCSAILATIACKSGKEGSAAILSTASRN